jgi:hypothetical protein
VRNSLDTLCKLIVDDVGETNKPDLLISCFGGAEYFIMNDNLEKEFMNGIGQVATTKGKQEIKICLQILYQKYDLLEKF